MPKTDPYQAILTDIIEKVKAAQYRAGVKVNAELLFVYWYIGNHILQQQQAAGWGAKIIDQLARDLKITFPGTKGYSVRNLKYMRLFAESYPEFGNTKQVSNTKHTIVQGALAQSPVKSKKENVQGMLAQISWYHHITLLDKVKNSDERLFYISEAVANGWSRDVMVMQIETNLYKRHGKAITNFSEVMGHQDSDLAIQTLKNPYILDFIQLTGEVKERDVEKAIIQHLKKFMLELGKGFAYLGNQYNLKVEGDDYFLDLLFYNTVLHCYVIFELKIGEFKPEYAGKLNFYINTIDAEIKTDADAPTIGVLLCKTPNETVVKYALQGITRPIGVSEYKLQDKLPAAMKKGLPTIKELETELEKEAQHFKLKQKAVKK